ncbi:RNA methyltransferase [Gemmatimonadetes bacterium T265]|nr:RNA methyltransferase [Gemmatimonadetes bacterium T265]
MPKLAASRIACYAVAAPGLEAIVAAEFAPLVASPVSAEVGGVAFTATRAELYRVNLWSRTASRVLVRLAEFDAAHFSELQRGCEQIRWEQFVGPRDGVRIRVTCRKSRLYHSDAVAERVGEAIRRRTGAVVVDGGAEDEEDAGGAQLVVVRLLHDHCTISADSSGELLHRRGYRQAVAKAPLRETLAAAMLLAAGYDGSGPLLDPLCGSGTIPIEAALIARAVAPGRHRAFAFERWLDFDADVWHALRARADEGVHSFAPHPIAGSDRDAGAVRAALANAERAGVADDVVFEPRALSAAVPPAASAAAAVPGWLVTNPPYGKRLGEADALRDLWARLGQFAHVRCPGWRMGVLAPGGLVGARLDVPLATVAATRNGGLAVDIAVGAIPDARDP